VNNFPHHCLPIADAIRADYRANASRKVKTITLSYSPDSQVWMAEYLIDNVPDAHIQDLFGTHIIATPFGSEWTGFDVLNTIRDRNPGVQVSLADCGTVPASFNEPERDGSVKLTPLMPLKHGAKPESAALHNLLLTSLRG
jgi:hypothetical protein